MALNVGSTTKFIPQWWKNSGASASLPTVSFTLTPGSAGTPVLQADGSVIVTWLEEAEGAYCEFKCNNIEGDSETTLSCFSEPLTIGATLPPDPILADLGSVQVVY
jgi:hypothetical protein